MLQVAWVCPVIAWTLAAMPATVNPSGDGARASTAARAARIRGLFTSMPPTRLAPSCAGSGS